MTALRKLNNESGIMRLFNTPKRGIYKKKTSIAVSKLLYVTLRIMDIKCKQEVANVEGTFN